MILSKSTIVKKELQGERFDIAATTLFSNISKPDEGISRKKIKAIIDAGGAYLNKRRVIVASIKVNTGDKLEIFWSSTEKSEIGIQFAKNEFKAENIIFEDDNMLVINKPAGIPTQATLESDKNTIMYAINSFSPDKYKLDSLLLVHRLDKDTSGILLIAKNPIAKAYLEKQFVEKKVKKTYLCLTFNVPQEGKGAITYALAPNKTLKNTYFPIMNQGRNIPGAKTAVTMFKVLKAYSKVNASLIECNPQTGRTHQIRVHLMAIGCPILGDKTYAKNILGHSLGQIALRHMLHASGIKFKALNGKDMEFELALPSDFEDCLKEIEAKNGNNF